MIYLIFGQDLKRSRKLLSEFEDRFRREAASGWQSLDGRECEEIEVFFAARSLFGNKDYFLIKHASLLGADSKNFLSSLLGHWEKDDSVIVFYEEGVPEKDELFLELKKRATKKQEFKELVGESLNLWLQSEAVKRSLHLSVKDKLELFERAGKDLGKLENELEKMALGYQRTSYKDVPKEKDLFLLGDLWGGRQIEVAVLGYWRLLRGGIGPDQILRVLLWHVKNLLLVLKRETRGLHPFVVRKAEIQARLRERDKLLEAYDSLLLLDIHDKWGRGSLQYGILHFLLTK